MPAPPLPDAPDDQFPSVPLLATLLDTNLLGMVFYLPLYDEAGALVDLAFGYLNPAGQRIMRLPAQPTTTYRQLFPSTGTAREAHVWAYHRDAFLSGAPVQFEVYYQADGYDDFYRLSGQRVGRGLLLSFTDTAAQDRSAAEQHLRERQLQAAAEQQQLQAIATTLVETNRRLTRTNADLDMFVYTASHDLKTPLDNLEGLLQALQEELPATVREAPGVAPLLRMLHHATDRFQQTLQQLADLAQVQQAAPAPAELVAVAPLVQDVVQDLAPQVAATEATLTVEVAADLRVHLAPATLRSIVFNLLSNALKYRDPQRPSHVRVRGQIQLPYFLLEVHDTGLGLTVAQQQELFGMFRRLHSHVEGTGIGLYAIKRLIENADGDIGVDSAPGVGSTFRVRLPLPGQS